MFIDNYVATHRRVSSQCPRAVAGRRQRTLARERRAGDGSTRAAGADSRTAETRAQGHLTSWEPKRKPGAVTRGAGRRPPDAQGGQDTPRPLGAQAAGTSGQQRRSGRIVSGSSGFLSCLRLPRHRLPRPRLPLPSRAPATPTSAGPRKRPGPPSSQPRNGSLSELSVSSSSSTFQFHTPQPPVIASQTNMAAAAAAA